jgi:hypothetical protein
VKHLYGFVIGLVLTCASATPVGAQQPATASNDVYHVHFTKAVPGQAGALGEFLRKPDPRAAMPEHFIVLRHQQGDDWDYCVIQHLGSKGTVDPAGTPPNPSRDLRAWHTDTFVSGPPWAEFAKSLGIGDAAGSTAGSVYSVAVWQAAPGHRNELQQTLERPAAASKVQVSRVVLQHLEGGAWQYLAIDRYNSWQDFATDQAASAAGTGSARGPDGWSQIRQHSSFHRDTLADRLAPK